MPTFTHSYDRWSFNTIRHPVYYHKWILHLNLGDRVYIKLAYFLMVSAWIKYVKKYCTPITYRHKHEFLNKLTLYMVTVEEKNTSNLIMTKSNSLKWTLIYYVVLSLLQKLSGVMVYALDCFVWLALSQTLSLSIHQLHFGHVSSVAYNRLLAVKWK